MVTTACFTGSYFQHPHAITTGFFVGSLGILMAARFRNAKASKNVSLPRSCPIAVRDSEEDKANPMLVGFELPLRLSLRVNFEDAALRDIGCIAAARALVGGVWSDIAVEDVSITCLQGGLTNQLYLLRRSSSSSSSSSSLDDGPPAVLVRLYGLNTELIIERSEEEIVFHIMAQKRFAPTVYGFFQNGRVEQFIPNVGVELSDLGAGHFPQMIATELAQLHHLDMPLSREPFLWVFIHKFDSLSRGMAFPGNVAEQSQLDALQLDNVRAAMNKLAQRLPSKFNDFGAALFDPSSDSEALRLAKEFLFKPVFCHNDLLAGNILFLPEEDRVQFIDFEYSTYNFRGFDFGNHFCEYAGFDFDLKKWYPSPTAQRRFVEHYIVACADQGVCAEVLHLYHRLSQDNVLADQFYKHCIEWIDDFATCANIKWGFWALAQKKYSPIDFDYLNYARLRLGAVSI